MFDSIASIAGPIMTIAGVATANPALAIAGIGASSYSAMQGQKDANQANVDMANNANAMSVDQARITREFNAAEAQKNRDFQQENSNTAYRRATADLQAAGLNPMLAYSQGGASTPSGASATSSAAQIQTPARMENVNSRAVSSAMQGAQTMLAAQNSAADIQLKNQQANTQAAMQEQSLTQSALNKAEAAKTMSQTYNPSQFGKFVDSQISQNRANAQLQGNTAQNVKDLVAPTSDPWYLRNIKSLHNSALSAYQKSAGSTGTTYQLFNKLLGR